MLNGAFLHPVKTYLDEGIYLVRQLPPYSMIFKMCYDDPRNMKGHSLPVMTFEIPSPFAFIVT